MLLNCSGLCLGNKTYRPYKRRFLLSGMSISQKELMKRSSHSRVLLGLLNKNLLIILFLNNLLKIYNVIHKKFFLTIKN